MGATGQHPPPHPTPSMEAAQLALQTQWWSQVLGQVYWTQPCSS